MHELTLAVVGITYANNDKSKSSRMYELLLCKPGEPVHLVPEPKNEHDRNAIAVFSSRHVQLGYVTAERAPWIGGRLRSTVASAIFQSLEEKAAYIRVRFGGGEPTLPGSALDRAGEPPVRRAFRPQAEPDSDFYPDPDGPEWGA